LLHVDHGASLDE